MWDENKPILGVVQIASASRLANVGDDVAAARTMLSGMNGVEIVQADEVVTSRRQANEAVAKLRSANVDLLLIHLVTYAADELSARISNGLDVPLLFWGVPEPLLKGNIKSGSLVGYVQSAGVISKLDRHRKFLWGSPEDANVHDGLRTSINAVGTAKALRRSRIGQIGHHCPGMLDEGFHELELTRVIGPEVESVGLSVLIDMIRGMDSDRVRREVEKTLQTGVALDGPTPEDLAEAVKIYLALKDVAAEYSLDAMAVKCWPELMRAGVMSPCLALSKLNDDGIMTSCEGDVTAAATMLALHQLTGKPVFLADLFEMRTEDDSFFLYHCGAAPTRLAANAADVRLRTHFRQDKPLDPMVLKPGVIADFAVKPGRVTFARLTEKKGRYRMLIMGGEAIEQENLIGGNCARVRMKGKVDEILETMVMEGIEHHQLLAHGDVKEELKELSRLLGIEPIIL